MNVCTSLWITRQELEKNLSPAFIDPHKAGFVQEIETVTAPAPLLGQIDESALHRIAMRIPQFFDALLRCPHVEMRRQKNR
jgi:hypothetical protein